MVIYFIVGKTDNTQANTFKMRVPGTVMISSFLRKMRRTVYLDSEICTSAIEINDIAIKLLLSAKLIGMSF